ncbi:MAG: hypothetical protein D6705_05100 [Deltaproteobacteria bacterium]|nr:MAG: hypothetical protein D6705_05100 [Deltaproteobacteria bacterium]
MLEFLRRSASSVFAWIILGVLALVFGLSFGLPSDSLTFGAAPLVKVHGEDVTDADFRYQYAVTSRVLPMPKDERMAELIGVREEVLDAIVERLELAELARRMGLAATKWDAETLTLHGQFIALGDTFDWLGDAAFNYDLFKDGWLGALRVPEHRYLEVQADEILARTVRDLVTAASVVPPSEVRKAYEDEANRLSLRYVRFEAADYAQLVDPTREEIRAYLDAHRDELEAKRKKQALRFSKLPKQMQLYVIEVRKDRDDAAKLAAAARSRIARGERFEAVAREVSTHDSARRGGRIGWVSEEGTGSGLPPEVDEAARALETGSVSDVVDGEEAYYVVWVRGRREGDVPAEDALAELAEEALRDKRGKDLARQAAEEAILAAKAGKRLDDLFPREGTPGPGIEALAGGEAAPVGADEGPVLRVTGLFSKGKPIPGLGAQPELVAAAWAAEPGTEVLGEAFEIPTGYVVAGLERKEVATDEDFAEVRAELARRLAREKAKRVVSHFAARHCLEDKARGKVVPSEDRIARLMTYETKLAEEDGKRVVRPYSVCDRVGMRGGLLRTGLLARGGGG